MVALSLKICVRQCNVVKTMQFEPSTAVYDACRVIRERVPEAQTGQGEFLYLYIVNSLTELKINRLVVFYTPLFLHCFFLGWRVCLIEVTSFWSGRQKIANRFLSYKRQLRSFSSVLRAFFFQKGFLLCV